MDLLKKTIEGIKPLDKKAMNENLSNILALAMVITMLVIMCQ